MKTVKVTFLHPDLGIGGAERLVVDAALALKNRGYNVNFVTSHHDHSHCFKETKDGTLPVIVVGDWLPRSVFGRFYALCAYIRMIYAAFYLLFFSGFHPDLVFCDQVSVCIPILHLKVKNVIFYCHFPDQLLSVRGSKLKALYRLPLDYLEEKTTGCADKILVNSRFTQDVFKNTFRRLSVVPDVLYPSINTNYFDNEKPVDLKDLNLKLPDQSIIILSINRYERKKNIKLAISALSESKKLIKNCSWEKVHLVIAGGYDRRVEENVEYHDELVEFSKTLDLVENVHFLKSPSDAEKLSLLLECRFLVYTPSNEHFGIVPLEAMYARKPVIAVNTGGPLETVDNEVTGLLREPTMEEFGKAFVEFLDDENKAIFMGNAGRKRFEELFSFNAFGCHLNLIINNVLNKNKKD